MPTPTETKTPPAQKYMAGQQVLESTEFAGIMGSNAHKPWFTTLMEKSHLYLFSLALVLFVVKLGIGIYQYAKAPNKNVNEKAFLGWTILQTAAIGIAIIGSIAAAAAFIIITPAMFTATMAADTLRNITYFFWNYGKLISLNFARQKQLSEEKDEVLRSLTQLKYEALEKQYKAKRKEYFIGSMVGLAMTAAVLVIFLFPPIGLGAIGATAVIPVAWVGFKITWAAFTGVVASCALMAVALPLLVQLGKMVVSKIRNNSGENATLASKNDRVFIDDETKKISNSLGKKEVAENNSNSGENATLVSKNDRVFIDDEIKLKQARGHTLGFNACSKHSSGREIIIKLIPQDEKGKKLAIYALIDMIDNKLQALLRDLEPGEIGGGYQFFKKMQETKRLEKMYALFLLRRNLESSPEVIDIKEIKPLNVNKYNKWFEQLPEYGIFYRMGLKTLLATIQNKLPGISKSFKYNEADTQNIVNAVAVYEQRFVSEDSSSNSKDYQPM